MIRNRSSLDRLSKVLAICSGCLALVLAISANAANEQDSDCVTSRDGEVAGGCVLTYDIVTPAVTQKNAVPGVFNLEIAGVTYEGVTGEIRLGQVDVLTLATPDSTDTDGDGNAATVTFDSTMVGASARVEVVTAPVPERTAVAEVTTVKGIGATAIGMDAITKGAGSISIGEGANVGRVIPMVPAVPAQVAVPGVFNVEIAGVTYEGVTGAIRLGQVDVLTLATPDSTDADGDGNAATVTFDSTMAGASARVEVVTAPVPERDEVPAVPETRVAVENAIAIGAGASVTGDNGVALGAGASAEENAIALGAGVTAGENQIVIGTAGQSAVIGGVDLAGIATNVTGIATNTAGIATNVTGIATNTAGIATNVTGIATNTAGIATNVTGIATNRSGIDTNRSGIAMAIALAHLPSSLSAGSRGSWGIAAGTFDGKSALAGGFSFRIREKGLINVGISNSGGETGAGVGFSMEF